ncbi:MAG TPA: mechanosensitive ion channel domain-containing protein [Anaeromyxobacteraceae bacterium]|nr:mechanosensitive ion channel domain-containing protein [Anaeromyxobacteraceae bacterium]
MATRTSCLGALAAAALSTFGSAAAAPTSAVTGERAAPARTGAEAAPLPSPGPIPIEQVFHAAEELDAPLRRAQAAAKVDPGIEQVEERLASVTSAIESLRPDLEPQRLQDASARELDRLRQALARADLHLASGQASLEKRSDLLAGATREIQDRLVSWQLTADAARREKAPEAVLRRIAQALESLRVEEADLRQQRDGVLALQGRVSDLRAELSRDATSVAQAEAALERQLFEVESAPLWRALTLADRGGSLGGQVRQALRESAHDVATFVAEEQVRLWIHLGIVLALGLGLIALRRPVAALEARGAALPGTSRMLARPWSAALLVSLPLAGGLYPPLPPNVRDLLFLGFLAPLLRVLPGLVPALFRRPLYALAALFALDKLAAIAPPRTLLARLAVLLVSAGTLAAVLKGLRPGGWARFLGGGPWGLATRGAATAALVLLGVAVVSNVVGNSTLAELLTNATLTSAIVAAVLVGIEVVLEGAIAALLHLPAVQRRPLVARHHALLQRRTVALLRIACVTIWAWRTAIAFGVASALRAGLNAVFGLRLQVGGLDVSLGNVTAFVATLALALLLARAIRFVLDEGVFTEIELPRGVPAAITATVQYVLVVLGFSWAVLASGIEMSRFSFLLGALGLGVGFGLQNVVNNIVSGLILLYERPVQVRDIVEVGAVSGEVMRIGVRSSTVRTFAGAEVIVPNATLISTEVTNWTLSDRRRRVEVAVGAAYGSPPRQVIDLLLATVRGRAGVLESPEPVALLLRFGESAMEFALRFWTADFDRWQQLASDVMIEVHASLGRAGIEIPVPQRDLHLRSLDAAAAEALAKRGAPSGDGPDRERAEPEPAAPASRP